MKTSHLAALCAAGFVPFSAHAQVQLDAENYYLGTIVLTAPGVPVDEDGVSVTSEGIALSNPADLSELFVAEPTIAVGSSIPMSQKVYVNGIEENNLAISIDGARQNNKIFHHNTTTLIDPALLKAVRIDPGVAPADAGPGALGGALAYETKDVSDVLDADDTFGGRYKLEYDSNGEIFANSLSLYGKEGGFEYLGFFKSASGDLRADGDGVDIVGSGTNLQSALAKVAYEAADGSRFELSFEIVKDDEARPYRANIGRVNGGRPVPDTRPYDLDRTNVTLTYTTTAPTAMWDPKIQIAYSGTELFKDESTTSAAQTILGKTSTVSGVISNRFALEWAEINAGVDFYSDVAEIDYVYVPDAAYSFVTEEKLRNVGLFAQARMEPTRNSSLSFGMRLDHQEFTGTDGATQNESGVSANVAGEVSVTDQLTLSAGYSHVWGGIELAENYIQNPAWTYPAGGLEPVKAQNVYVAASFETVALTLDGKVFATQFNDVRAASWSGGPDLTAELDSHGFELGLAYAWNGGFFRAGYASIDTDLNGRVADSYTGNYLTMPLGDFLTFQAAHQFNNGLLIGGDAQIAFDYEDTYDFATGGQGPTLPGYTVVNAFVEYAPSRLENLTLRAEVNNLFDEQYAARATYGQEFPSFEPLYEPGRSVRISAELRF